METPKIPRHYFDNDHFRYLLAYCDNDGVLEITPEITKTHRINWFKLDDIRESGREPCDATAEFSEMVEEETEILYKNQSDLTVAYVTDLVKGQNEFQIALDELWRNDGENEKRCMDRQAADRLVGKQFRGIYEKKNLRERRLNERFQNEMEAATQQYHHNCAAAFVKSTQCNCDICQP